MNNFELLIDLHRSNHRQAPGDDNISLRVLKTLRLDDKKPLKIADIGCGTGAHTLILAANTNSSITAVDLSKEFTDELMRRAKKMGLQDRINCSNESMENLSFQEEDFDMIWSEGAIYCMGFEKGINNWKKFLKREGYLVISELVWLSDSQPEEIHNHWLAEYPEISQADKKIELLERAGYEVLDQFILPEYCWTENYYGPLKKEFDQFLKRNHYSKEAQNIIEAEKKEIELFDKYRKYFGYAFISARKIR